jgi:hypothetical protein
VPSERTFQRLLEKVDPEQLKNVLVGWMQTQDTAPLGVCLTSDAANTTKANCRQLTQDNGADFFLF